MRARATSMAVLVSALAVGLAALPAPAQSVWDGEGGMNIDWDNAVNWAGDVLPADLANVSFGTGGSGAAMGSTGGKNVTDITFNRGADFTMYSNTGYSWPNPREFNIYGNVTVSDANTYTISTRAYRTMLKADSTWNIATGGKLVCNTADTYSQQWCTYGYTITKTGLGTLEFSGNSSVSGLYGLGEFDIQAGTVAISTTSTTVTEGVGGGENGLLTSTGVLAFDQCADTDMEGVIQANAGISKYNVYDMTLSGTAGRIELSKGGEDGYSARISAGAIILDNTAVNRNDRLQLVGSGTVPDLNLSGGTLHLIGNDTVGSSDGSGMDLNLYSGFGIVKVTHGASASATITVGAISNNDSTAVLLFDANDLAAATGPGSYVMSSGVSLNDGIIGGFAFVGNEFAGYDNTLGVQALPAGHASRSSDVNASGATNNVLANSAQTTLTGNRTINSLKIDGAHGINLGGYILTIDTGGLIQTGADNNGIENGTLTTTTGRMYINNTHDLAITASLTGTSITKFGAGTLALGDTLLSEGIYLAEGGLNVNNNSDFMLIMANGGDPSDLVKGGTGTLTIDAVSLSDQVGGVCYINDGTVDFDEGDALGADVRVSDATIDFNGVRDGWSGQWEMHLHGTLLLNNGTAILKGDSTIGGTSHNPVDNATTIQGTSYINNPNDNCDMPVDYNHRKSYGELAGSGTLVYQATQGTYGATTIFQVASPNFTGKVICESGAFTMMNGDILPNAAGVVVKSGAYFGLRRQYVDMTLGYIMGDGTVFIGYNNDNVELEGTTLKPGMSIGTLSFNNLTGNCGVTFKDAVGYLEIEVADDAGTNDVLAVTGTVAGLDWCEAVFDLPVPSKAKFDINAGINVNFITGGVSGTFTAVSMSAAMDSAVAAHYLVVPDDIDTSSSATLVLTGTCWTAHSGDANLDDEVGIMDLVRVANNWDRSDADVTYITGDLNLNGTVSITDLVKIANNFGWKSGAGGAEAVPEPLTLAVLALGSVVVLRRRRR